MKQKNKVLKRVVCTVLSAAMIITSGTFEGIGRTERAQAAEATITLTAATARDNSKLSYESGKETVTDKDGNSSKKSVYTYDQSFSGRLSSEKLSASDFISGNDMNIVYQGAGIGNSAESQNISIRQDIYTSITFNVKASDNSNDVKATFVDTDNNTLIDSANSSSGGSDAADLTVFSKGSSSGNAGFLRSSTGGLFLSTTGNGDLTVTSTGTLLRSSGKAVYLYIHEVGNTTIKSRIFVYNPLTVLGGITGDGFVTSGQFKDLELSLSGCTTRNADVTKYSGRTDGEEGKGSNGETTDLIQWSSEKKADIKRGQTISSDGTEKVTYTAPAGFTGTDKITAKRVSGSEKDTNEGDIVATISYSVADSEFEMSVNPANPATHLEFLNGSKFNVESGKELNLATKERLKTTTNASRSATDNFEWSSSDSSVATVSEDGNVKGLKAGTTTITVKGQNEGVSASCEVTVYVKADTLTISRTDGKNIKSLNKHVGGHETVSVTETLSTNSSTKPTEALVASSNSDLVKVSEEQYKDDNVRNFEINVNDDTELTEMKTVVVTFRTDRTAGNDTETADKDTKTELTLYVYPKISDDTDITFRNKSDNSVIDDDKGIDTWIGDKEDLSIKADSTSDNDKVNDEFEWGASGTEGDKAESSHDLDTLTVTPKKRGDIKYTATSVSNKNVTKDVYVHVKQPVTSLGIDQSDFVINVGDSRTLTTTELPEENDDSVTWTSSDEDYLSVDNNGKVTALKAYTKGEVTITVKSKHSGITDKVEVTVVNASNLSITNDQGNKFEDGVIEGKDSVSAGSLPDSDTIYTKVSNEEGIDYEKMTVSWESSDTDVVTVTKGEDDSSTATLTYGKAGSAKVTAKVGELTDVIIVNVKADISKVDISGLSVTASDNKFSYLPNGAHPDFKVSASYGNDNRSVDSEDYTLAEDTDYTVTDTYDNKTGTYKYTLTGKGFYSGEKELKYTVSKINFSESDGTVTEDEKGNGILKLVDSNNESIGTITFKAEDVIYNGKEQKPEFTAVFEKDGYDPETLEFGNESSADLNISYKNNKNAYEDPSVTISGRGDNFTGSTVYEKAFKINPYDISELENDDIEDKVYTGKEQTPAPVLYRTNGISEDGEENKKDKINNTEVVVSYKDNIKHGTASIVITPKETESNYKGTKTIKFNINKASFDEVNISDIAAQTFTGLPLTPLPEVTFNNLTVDPSEFKAEYGNNVNVSAETSAVVTLTAVEGGDFAGFKSGITFRINKKNLSDEDIEISPIKDQYYTQFEMEPMLTVTNTSNNVPLLKGVDYTAEYTNNVNRSDENTEESGKPQVKITGTGNYQGTRTAYFTIKDKDKAKTPADEVVISTDSSAVGDYEPAYFENDTIYMDKGETKALHLTLKSGGGSSDDIVYIQKGSQDDASLTLSIKGLTEGDDGTLLVKANSAGASSFTINAFAGKLNKKINVVSYNKAVDYEIQSDDENVKAVEGVSDTYSMIQNHAGQFKTSLGTTQYDDTVTWSVDNDDLAEINEDGLLTAKKEGTVIITAKVKPRENDERGLTRTAMLHITQNTPATSITFDKSSYDLKLGDKVEIIAAVLPDNNTEQLVWRSSDETVATVDKTGTVTGLKEGTAVISCSSFDGKISTEAKVTIYTSGNSITLDSTDDTMYIGEKLSLTARVLPETATDYFVWKVENTQTNEEDAGNIVKIDIPQQNDPANSSTVEITGAAKGTVHITVTSTRTGRNAYTTISVRQPVTGITLDKSEITLEEGGSDTITAAVAPEDATDIPGWKSSDEGIATVDNYGKVTAVAEGTATIVCSSGSVTAECKVTVTKKATPTPVVTPTPTLRPTGTPETAATATPKTSPSASASSTPKTTASPKASGTPGSSSAKSKSKRPGAIKKITVRRAGRYAKITWSKAKKAKGYQVVYSASPKFAKARRKFTKGRTFKIRRGRVRYYVRVRAYALSGKKKVFGKWSAKKRI